MSNDTLTIDGSFGEGGGQILRSSLALSMITQRPIQIENIRAGRKKPGLAKQHLTCVQAAKKISFAEVSGDHIGSQTLTFSPQEVQAGNYVFNIGTAGSTTLVFQTIFPALMLQSQSSHVILRGGTHNMKAPSFDFLARSFLPVLDEMGVRTEAILTRHGFFPAGGGEIQITIHAANGQLLKPLEILERGPLKTRRAVAMISKLPRHIAERELRTLQDKLSWHDEELEVLEVKNALGPGNVISLEIGSGSKSAVTEVITAHGEINKPAEKVAREAARAANAYLKTQAPIGEYLADQIMLPMAIAAHQGQGDSTYVISANSGHTQTHAELVSLFLNCEVLIKPLAHAGKSKTMKVQVIGR